MYHIHSNHYSYMKVVCIFLSSSVQNYASSTGYRYYEVVFPLTKHLLLVSLYF
jgi:hypothetical protein